MISKVYYIPHGGGPLPLMNDDSHKGIVTLMRGMEEQVAKSKAIIVITAHWEGDVVQLSGASSPSMLFDYYNFPPEAYQYNYPAPGALQLAQEAYDLLSNAGIKANIDKERGYDHGTFVPMMLIRPMADIPILQMSILASLDPAKHIELGKAMAPLLKQNITMIGSGLSFHNPQAFITRKHLTECEDEAFDKWLNDTLLDPSFSTSEREEKLTNWASAPGALACHPREEHLLPLHVCFGAATYADLIGKNIFSERLMDCQVSGFRWSVNG